jgi:hypothetical protein
MDDVLMVSHLFSTSSNITTCYGGGRRGVAGEIDYDEKWSEHLSFYLLLPAVVIIIGIICGGSREKYGVGDYAVMVLTIPS